MRGRRRSCSLGMNHPFLERFFLAFLAGLAIGSASGAAALEAFFLPFFLPAFFFAFFLAGAATAGAGAAFFALFFFFLAAIDPSSYFLDCAATVSAMTNTLQSMCMRRQEAR